MDEAEKYQQRLEAIAEKRRLQEVQERAKREMEEEKLRLQQLKRKSLRDQWLMEGAPLSPSSLDSQSPHSPPWASREAGKHRLLSQNVGFEGEDEKERIADDQTEAVDMDAGDMGTVEDYAMKAMQTSRDEDASVLMNGKGDLKSGLKQNHEDALGRSITTNGPSESVLVEKHGQHVAHLSCTEVDEMMVVMHAERVFITDDEEEVAPGEHQEEEGDTVEEAHVAPEASEELANEAASAAKQGGSTHEETEDEDIKAEDSASVQLHSPAGPLEVAPVAPVPVYLHSQALCPPPEESLLAKEEEAIMATSEAAEVSSEAQGDSLIRPPQFQEVSLSDSKENHRTDAQAAEREPLLEEAKAPEVQDDITTDNHSASTDIRGEAMQAPKKKVCLCCSLM